MIPELEKCTCLTRNVYESMERFGYDEAKIRSILRVDVHQKHCVMFTEPVKVFPAVEQKVVTIIRLNRLGAALAVMQGRIFYGPQNPDGSVKFDQAEFVEISADDILVDETPAMLRKQAD